MTLRRMRNGFTGRLIGGNGAVSILYSLDGSASRGRLRPLDPSAPFPAWLGQGTLAKLQMLDGQLTDIEVTLVKLPRDGWKNDDHFAEFVVRSVTH